jgi:hypothetical protein
LEIERILGEYLPPRKIADQAKPTGVKKLVAVESAPAAPIELAPAGSPSPELGGIPRHSDGAFPPTVKNSTDIQPSSYTESSALESTTSKKARLCI